MSMIFNQRMQSNYPQFKWFHGVPFAVVVCRLLKRGDIFQGGRNFFFFSCVGTKTKMLFHRQKYCSATQEVTKRETESILIVLLSTYLWWNKLKNYDLVKCGLNVNLIKCFRASETAITWQKSSFFPSWM